jgi:hypothetical protein
MLPLRMSDVVRPQRLKTLTWMVAFPRWPRPRDLDGGYTLLLPVPADLPVFLHLALANAQFQHPERRLETIVVPDMPSPAFRERFARAAERYDVGPLRLVEPGRRARVVRRLANAPAANYFLQIHAGVCAAGTTHALLHDADLFIEDHGFMGRHHRLAVESGAGCLGVSPVWDDWMREHGFGHVVATWELMLDVRWMRSFAPWKHRPHAAHLAGEWHVFDVTLYPQAVSEPACCQINDAAESFEHFNWVIGVYRYYQQSTGPYEDYRFLLLLIRLLSDAYASPLADIPAVATLAAGITDPGLRVTYVDPATRDRYPAFRAKLERIMKGPLLEPAAVETIERAVEPFDRAFAA